MRRSRRRLGENSRAVHLPSPPLPRQVPIGLPVWRTAAWAFESAGEYGDVLAGRRTGFVHNRMDNPTVAAFAAAVAALEGAAAPEEVAGEAFSSGMAAVSAVFMTFLRAGAHVVAPAPLNGPTYALLSGVLARFGVTVDFVDYSDLRRVRDAVRSATKIVYAETLANPTMTVPDLRALYQIAREAGALLVVDSSTATPIVCRPLEHGADLVVHSATKYFGGHDDCTGGVVVGRPDLLAQIREIRVTTGASLSPDDAFLLRRGLETLTLRVRRMCSTAMEFAAAVAKHPAVRRVDYPGLPDHPGHQLARQFFETGPEGTRFGACVTVIPHGGYEAGMTLANGLRLTGVGSSLGGTHTRAAHLASATRSDEALSGVDAGAVRFSIGLEDPDDLIMDVTSALDALRATSPTRG